MIFRAYPDAKSRQVLWQTIHLVSISTHVDYNWQTINYSAIIVIIIIIIEYIDLLNAQSVNDAHKQVKTVHLLFNTSKFYKTVVGEELYKYLCFRSNPNLYNDLHHVVMIVML